MANIDQRDVRTLYRQELYWSVLPRFWCQLIEHTLLKDATRHCDYQAVLSFYDGQVKAAAKCLLYPGQLQEQMEIPDELSQCYRHPGSVAPGQGWSRLISDIGHVAARILLCIRSLRSGRDRLSRAEDRTTREKLALQLVVAMRLMTLARLYFEREKINNLVANPMQSERVTMPNRGVVQKYVRLIVAQYDRQVRTWGIAHVLPRGWKDGSDAFAYDQWSQNFGVVLPGEEGWSSFPRVFHRELRYVRSRSNFRQQIQDVPGIFSRVNNGGWWRRMLLFFPRVVLSSIQLLGNLGSILLLWFFMLTCGFGFRPRRLVGTVLCVIPLFAGLYFADDTVIERCSAPTSQQLMAAVYSALTSLVSLGSSAHLLCGTHVTIVSYLETLIGYFVLSLLAATLFTWITER